MRFKQLLMPVSKAHRTIAVSLAGLLIGAGAVALCLHSRPTLLLNAARHLAWDARDADTGGIGYGWLSDTDLLALRDRAPADANEYRPRYAVRWNRLTGIETRLPSLSTVINTGHGDGPYLQSISPDGRRLLWTNPVSATRHFYTAFVDGHGLLDVCEQMYHANAPTYEEMLLWMGDSHTLLQVGDSDNQNKLPHGQYAWKLDLDKPSPVRRLPAIQGGVFDAPQDIISMPGDSLRVVLNPSVQADDSTISAAYLNEARLEEWRVDGVAQCVRQWAVPLPHPAQSFTARFAPCGDHIAWLLNTRWQSSFDVLLHRWLPAHAAPVWHQQQLWISRADGSDMRHVGDLPAVGFDTNGQPLQPDMMEDETEARHLQWLPGGTKISFLYKAALYLVDAPHLD